MLVTIAAKGKLTNLLAVDPSHEAGRRHRVMRVELIDRIQFPKSRNIRVACQSSDRKRSLVGGEYHSRVAALRNSEGGQMFTTRRFARRPEKRALEFSCANGADKAIDPLSERVAGLRPLRKGLNLH